MPPSYMLIPKNKLTLGSTELTNTLASAKVTRNENGFDQATIALTDTSLFPSTVNVDTEVKLEVADEDDVYPTNPMFKGKVRFPIVDIGDIGKDPKTTLTLSCLGTGYGFGDMVVVKEYGEQSSSPALNTLYEIIDDMIENYVNFILGINSSGFSYTHSITPDYLTNSIPFIAFPYKPVLNSINDLVDLSTAMQAGTRAGPHWIVTTDNVFRMKPIGNSQTGWSKYYGGTDNTAGQATLTYGVDYTHINSEIMKAEKNYIIYYGMWRRPSNGDCWTESSASLWDKADASDAVFTDDSTEHIVGSKSLKVYTATGGGVPNSYAFFPGTLDAHWDFSGFTDFNTPNLNFYIKTDSYAGSIVRLCTSGTAYFQYNMAEVTANNAWFHVSLPCGPHYKNAVNGAKWSVGMGSPSWSDINFLMFESGSHTYYIDGLHFGDAPICRVAWNSDLPGGTAKMQLITDNTGKDDTLKAGTPGTTDQGLMAQYAYAELLRKQTDSQNLIVDLASMLPTVLPGQFFSVQSTDFRVTQIIHTIDSGGYGTQLKLTDDLTNGLTRARYEDQNKVWASIRPEWQDKQAASIKAGDVDWRIAQLIEDYA